MKKYLLLPTLALLLAACGSEDSQEPMQESEQPDVIIEDEEVEGMYTSDPVEFADKDSDLIYQSGEMNLEIVARYKNDDTDSNGFNTVSFDGYDYKFAVVAIEGFGEKPTIAVLGETENNTEDSVAFNSDVEIVTDKGDQERSYDGVGRSEPGVKKKAFITVDIEYGVPDSFKLTMQPPMKEVGEDQYEEGHYGEPKVFEFEKE
ncbi:hypothetical protein CSV61_02180 [Sporosarcina sp. P3]|uniref:hypothetical protein n=1 Tax=Sporosarcina sp. P3 TaxID=2048245 RepID=UPI000C163FD0|nr:hypothetical protein [Sporosarcina sp. P3]PID22474.1 hypothetical protein CSV61_02180 [Sporosarcina sp. P3]